MRKTTWLKWHRRTCVPQLNPSRLRASVSGQLHQGILQKSQRNLPSQARLMVAITKAGNVSGKTEAVNRSIAAARPYSLIRRLMLIRRLIQTFRYFSFIDIGLGSLDCTRVALVFHSMSDV